MAKPEKSSAEKPIPRSFAEIEATRRQRFESEQAVLGFIGQNIRTEQQYRESGRRNLREHPGELGMNPLAERAIDRLVYELTDPYRPDIPRTDYVENLSAEELLELKLSLAVANQNSYLLRRLETLDHDNFIEVINNHTFWVEQFRERGEQWGYITEEGQMQKADSKLTRRQFLGFAGAVGAAGIATTASVYVGKRYVDEQKKESEKVQAPRQYEIPVVIREGVDEAYENFRMLLDESSLNPQNKQRLLAHLSTIPAEEVSKHFVAKEHIFDDKVHATEFQFWFGDPVQSIDPDLTVTRRKIEFKRATTTIDYSADKNGTIVPRKDAVSNNSLSKITNASPRLDTRPKPGAISDAARAAQVIDFARQASETIKHRHYTAIPFEEALSSSTALLDFALTQAQTLRDPDEKAAVLSAIERQKALTAAAFAQEARTPQEAQIAIQFTTDLQDPEVVNSADALLAGIAVAQAKKSRDLLGTNIGRELAKGIRSTNEADRIFLLLDSDNHSDGLLVDPSKSPNKEMLDELLEPQTKTHLQNADAAKTSLQTKVQESFFKAYQKAVS